MSFGGGFNRGGYGDDGGGFVSGSQQGSQGGGGGGGRTYQEESLRPVTIKQILEGTVTGDSAAETRIDGAAVTQVTLVGQIRALEPAATVVKIRLDDGTGVVDVKKYIEADKQDDVVAGLAVDMHVRVWGKLKPFGGKQFVQALVVRPVESLDEVNYHMLESSYVHLYMTRGPLGGGAGAGHDGGGGDSLFVDGGAGGVNREAQIKLNSCTSGAKRMFMFLQKQGSNEGIHLQLIANGAGMSVRDVVGAADELLGQGLIYTTIDDETWAILDY